MQPLLAQACWDTLYMVGWSTLIAVVGGLPLGILLVLTDRGGLLQNVVANKVIGQVVNVARSLPFIILMVALMGFTLLLQSRSRYLLAYLPVVVALAAVVDVRALARLRPRLTAS